MKISFGHPRGWHMAFTYSRYEKTGFPKTEAGKTTRIIRQLIAPYSEDTGGVPVLSEAIFTKRAAVGS